MNDTKILLKVLDFFVFFIFLICFIAHNAKENKIDIMENDNHHANEPPESEPQHTFADDEIQHERDISVRYAFATIILVVLFIMIYLFI